MSALLVVLIGTIIGGLIGYLAFWLRANWDFFSHGAPLLGLLFSFSFAGNSVFRGALVGLVVGSFVAAIADLAPW